MPLSRVCLKSGEGAISDGTRGTVERLLFATPELGVRDFQDQKTYRLPLGVYS
jgi:hypothetical protein